MIFLKTFLDFFKRFDAKEKLLIIALLIIGFLAVENVHRGNQLKRATAEAKKTEQNLKAAQDSIRIVKDNAGKVEYDKLTYIVDNFNELKKQNAELAQEVKNTKGKVLEIQKQGYVIVHDTTQMASKGELKDSVVTISSTYDSVYSKGNYRSLAFNNTFNLKNGVATGLVTKDRIGFTAVTGLKLTEKGYEIFVKPQYPGMELVSLEGATIDKNYFNKTQKIHLITVGASIGWTPIVYDLRAKKGDINLNRIGAGVNINFNLGKIFGK